MTNPQEQFLDLYRAGLKAGVDLMRASLQGAEYLRNRELAAIHQSLADIARSVAEIDAAKTLDELLALQAKLAGAQLARGADYMSGVWQAAREGQAEMLKLAQGHAARISGNLQEAAQSAGGANRQMLDALGSMLAANAAALGIGARGTAEAEPALSGAEADTVSAGVRRAGGRERKTA